MPRHPEDAVDAPDRTAVEPCELRAHLVDEVSGLGAEALVRITRERVHQFEALVVELEEGRVGRVEQHAAERLGTQHQRQLGEPIHRHRRRVGGCAAAGG